MTLTYLFSSSPFPIKHLYFNKRPLHRRNPTAVAQRLKLTHCCHTAVHTNVTAVTIATSVTSVVVTVSDSIVTAVYLTVL